MKIRLSVTIAALGVLVSGYANAVPCGTYDTYGGVQQATTCQNAPSGNANDTVADLNDGNYFGYNDWQLLTSTGDQGGTGSDYWTGIPASGGVRSGTFQLVSGIWDDFASLVVVLRDGGSWHDSRYKWAAYLLPEDFLGTYNWSYDGGHKALSRMTLYGRLPPPVAEPASFALVLTGLAGLAYLRWRRQSA